MKRLILLVAGGVIALVAVFSLVLALIPRSLPPSTQYITAYPNATHLHQDYTSAINVKALDFQTSVNPQTIQELSHSPASRGARHGYGAPLARGKQPQAEEERKLADDGAGVLELVAAQAALLNFTDHTHHQADSKHQRG